MACEYCKDEKPLYSAHERGMGAEVTIEDDSLMIDLFSDFVEIVITHCPMCGEPLTPIKPLTLEQLRERNGKPVYCMGIVNAGLTDWGIVNAAKRKVYDGGGDFWDFDEHGNAWLAYDRKPQIANETKGG